MVDWFRSWHGAPMDAKFLVVARNAGVTPGIVSWLFWHLCDIASSDSEDRGSISSFDPETASVWTGWPQEQIESALHAMREKGMITNENRLHNWEKRQPKREDDSRERVRAFRARRDAEKRDVTQCNAPEEKRVEENPSTEESPPTPTETRTRSSTRKTRVSATEPPPGFDLFWQAYPRRDAKRDAMQAFRKALETGATAEELLRGARSYSEHCSRLKADERRFIKLPATWLNKGCWEDEGLFSRASGFTLSKRAARAT